MGGGNCRVSPSDKPRVTTNQALLPQGRAQVGGNYQIVGLTTGSYHQQHPPTTTTGEGSRLTNC